MSDWIIMQSHTCHPNDMLDIYVSCWISTAQVQHTSVGICILFIQKTGHATKFTPLVATTAVSLAPTSGWVLPTDQLTDSTDKQQADRNKHTWVSAILQNFVWRYEACSSIGMPSASIFMQRYVEILYIMSVPWLETFSSIFHNLSLGERGHFPSHLVEWLAPSLRILWLHWGSCKEQGVHVKR